VSITVEGGQLRIPFSLRGLDGHVDVSLTRNTDPGSLGYLLLSGGEPVDFARDFPVCRATVTYPAEGYAAMTAAGRPWDPDLIAVHAVNSAYAVRPTS